MTQSSNTTSRFSSIQASRGPSTTRYQLTTSSAEALRRPIIIWDTETSGLSPTKNRIVEIAFLLFDLDISSRSSSCISASSSRGATSECSFTSFVRPDDNQRPWYGTGIKWADISGAPTFKQIWPTILNFVNTNCSFSSNSNRSSSPTQIDNRPIFIAHNLSFDYNFLGEELRRIGETIPSHWDFGCSLRDVAHVAWPGQPASLSALVKRLGIQQSAHRALSDSRAVAQVLRSAESSSNDSKLLSTGNKSVYDVLVRAAASRREIRQSGKAWGNGFAGTSGPITNQSIVDSKNSNANSAGGQNVPASVAYVRNMFNAQGTSRIRQ